jgi:murein DD-endopeptidase MepM/ murein hydrolase activator NlpD
MLLVTSDAVDANLKQYRLHPWLLYTVLLVLCAGLGVMIGFFLFEQDMIGEKNTEILAGQESIAALEEEKTQLEQQIASLNESVQILSDTVNQKTQSESLLSEQLEKQSLPTEFPLTGSASVEEITEGNPMCLFTATSGSMVVATAGGTVTAVNDDSEYGHSVWIDHGNGYVTIYLNQGEVKVKQGEEITQGTTLFVISDDNSKFGYQMMLDDAYIDPMDMLSISG